MKSCPFTERKKFKEAFILECYLIKLEPEAVSVYMQITCKLSALPNMAIVYAWWV